MKKDNYKTYARDSIYSDKLKDFCVFAKDDDFIEVTEWWNGEGFDVTIHNLNQDKNFSLTYGEYRLLKKLIKQFNKQEI